MPTSVKELKGLTDHVLCHTTCGQNKTCHESCPNSNWDEKKAECTKYQEMVECHKACGWSHSCHATCPHGPYGHGQWHHGPHEHQQWHPEQGNLIKEVIETIVV